MPNISLSLNRAAWEVIMDDIPSGKRSAWVSNAILAQANLLRLENEKRKRDLTLIERHGVVE